jgi:Raf kinase inhibitor-like YbhB/YbcL family protein
MKLSIMVLLLSLTVLCSTTAARKEILRMETLTISSPVFNHGEAIPVRFSCDGTDASPPLVIGKIPPTARSLALIMDDPDAPVGTWVHWVVWNIPVQTREIPENSLPHGAIQGRNDWKRNSYGGPCPPSGTHRYYFRLFALDTSLQLTSSTTKADLERAMQGHVLARGELMGIYRRR